MQDPKRSDEGRSGNARRYENYTPIPNFFLDTIMPLVPPADFKVLLFIWRKTVGWQKARDFVSLTQIQRGAGVCRAKAVSSLRVWIAAGLLRRVAKSGIRGTVCYEIVRGFDSEAVTSALHKLVRSVNWFTGRHSTSSLGGTPLVRQADTQKKSSKRNLKKERGAVAPSARGKGNGEGKYAGIPTH